MSGDESADEPSPILRRKGLPLRCNETHTEDDSSKMYTVTSLQDLGLQVLIFTQVLACTTMLHLKQHPHPGDIIRCRLLLLRY